MMSVTSFIESSRARKLGRQARPLWLWDSENARISWANEACLSFAGARSLDDLLRLKFAPSSLFVRQLAKLSRFDLGEEGRREMIHFPLGNGDLVYDCLCKNIESEPGHSALLVELLSSRTEKPEGEKLEGEKPEGQKVQRDAAGKVANGVLADVVSARQEVAPMLVIDPGRRVNGTRVEPAQVDEEDLLTLQEIARMINGSGGEIGEGGASKNGQSAAAGRGLQNADRDTARDAGQEDVSKPPAGGPIAGNGKKTTVIPAPLARSSAPVLTAEQLVASSTGMERNYFLESLPAALAIAMGGRLMRANQSFLYAFGFGSESELRKAGGLAALFPQSEGGVLKPAPVDEEAGGRKNSDRSGQVVTLGVSRSKRKRLIPVAYRNVSTGAEPVQILILHEDALSGLGEPVKPVNDGSGQDSLDFLAAVNHEVRTPLNSIIGFSELMKDEFFGVNEVDRFRSYASDIHDSAMHALSLINDLLDITKIIAGKPDLDFEPVDLNEAVGAALKLMAAQGKKKNIVLHRQLDASLPQIMADPRSIKQILLNLISNAIKFTPDSGEVSVITKGSAQGIVLQVCDTGIGMNKAQIKLAQEPFGRIHGAGQSSGEDEAGTGLGLPLAKALVGAHQASFNIDSEPGQGTTITICFPFEQLKTAMS